MNHSATESDAVVDAVVANQMLDKMIATLGMKNDAALARALEVAPPVLSKLRHGRLSFGCALVVRTHELTGWTIREIKGDLGLPCLAQVR